MLHLASLVPFFVGILLAVTVFRKKFGPLPTAFFVLISGLGPACLEYNLEVRMYSLAFLGILGTFWSAYRIISSGKRSAWTGMVLWGLMAAYSHYYALVVAGIMIFFTGAVYWVKYRGSTWRKGLLAIAAFLLGYAPWLFFLFTATSNVSGNWWVSELLGLDRVFNMVLGNMGLGKILMPLWMLLLAVVLLADSRIKNWSDEACTMAIGALTIGATIVFAYLLCFVMGQNVLQERYLYPLTAVTIFMLVLGSSRVLALLREYSEGAKLPCLETFAKTAMVTVLSVLLGLAIGNYKEYAGETRLYDEGTETTLEIIGEPEADVNFVSNGVQHLAWTVLYHYYPGNKIISGNYAGDNGGRFWYFTPDPLSEGDLERLEGEGITVLSYGENILARYSFELYYMEKTETAAAETAGDWTITQYGPREINSGFYTIYHPGKGLILVDGGWEEDADYVREQIHALGGKVDFWILTHPHQDHVGAFTEIYRNLQDIEIGEIYTVKMPEPARCLEVASWDDMTAYENFLALNVENLQYVSPGDVLDLLGLEFRIYNAFDSAVEELSGDYLNDGSMMFEVMGEKTSFLFCADVGKNMSDHLLEKWGEALQADYLQMGHHGYGGLQDDFYEMVSPDIAFFDAPESMMQDDTGRYDNPENAALMESLGSQVISFGQAPYTLVLE